MGVAAWGKKVYSIGLVFNCLVTILYAMGLLAGFYQYGWLSFTPYIVDSNIIWIIIVVSVFNMFPAATIGQTVETGRLWFHHYFWGFIVMVSAFIYLVIAYPSDIPTILTKNIPEIAPNIGRFFLLAGLAMIIDDFPDISSGAQKLVCTLKARAHRGRYLLHYAELILGFISSYFFVAITSYQIANPVWATPANLILSGCLFITVLTCFWAFVRKIWLKIDCP